jgi:hypothetical protein
MLENMSELPELPARLEASEVAFSRKEESTPKLERMPPAPPWDSVMGVRWVLGVMFEGFERTVLLAGVCDEDDG